MRHKLTRRRDLRHQLSLSGAPAGQLRVAIIGLGPKGTFALERLLDHARADPAARITLDAFEPHPAPGAGPVYDPAQAHHLRMNFPAGQVNMWWPGSTVVPPAERQSFLAWSHARGQTHDPASYPPRADVGRYLADGLRLLAAHAPDNVELAVRPTRVNRLRSEGPAWVLSWAGGSAAYDEVLIATGHGDAWDGTPATTQTGPAPLTPAVFPVDRWLSPTRIPPGATVAIRGFALSFIDAALTLTEGRGGSFAPLYPERRDRSETNGEVLPACLRLRYVAGDDDARLIFPFSRTGRPMLAKPGAGLAATIPGLEEIADRGRRQIASLAPPVDLNRDVLPILAASARASLRAAGVEDRVGLDAWLAGAAAGSPLPADQSPLAELRRSLEVGAGLASPDLTWALGQTWRGLYPAVVAGLAGNRLASTDWPAFRRLAAELERVSFGPPPINVAKLLALVDAGRVDLTHVHRGRLVADLGRTLLRSERGDQPIDVVVDGVLPGPGPGVGRSRLLGALVDDGHVRIAPGRRGISVEADGSCRGADDTTTPGLAAIGRPTEDSVIGNDTLSRTLHPLADRWARRIVERSTAPALAASLSPPARHAAG